MHATQPQLNSISLGTLELDMPADDRPLGTRVFAALVGLAESAIGNLRRLQYACEVQRPMAVLGRLRGTGRGVSFTSLVSELERSHPLEMEYPFEGSDRVGGAVWLPTQVLNADGSTSVAKLCWDSRATDLPMHVHDNSDRFIIVLKGRGYFHVADETAEEFTGERVRSIPARSRDVFLFSRGTVHTFSTDAEPMTLLSCQLPFLPFEDPKQYRLPEVRWIARDNRDPRQATVACDPAWSVLAAAPATMPGCGERATGMNDSSWWAVHAPH